MTTNSFRKKALSAGLLARAFTKTLGNARARGTLSQRDVARLVRVSDRLNDNAYLRRSLISNPFGDDTSFLLTRGRDTNASNVLRSLSNLNKPMPKNLQRLRGIIRDINNDITNYPVGQLSVQGMPNSRKLLLQHIGDLLSFMQKMPDVTSSVARANRLLNDTLILLNNAVRRRNGKLKSYRLGLLISTDAAGRNYYMDKDGMFFKLLLMDPTTGNNVHKVTRLKDNGRLLTPAYNGRQYWSDDGKELVPGLIIEDSGKRFQVYKYKDGSLYVRRYIGPARTKSQTQVQPAKNSTAAAPALPAVSPAVPAIDTSRKIPGTTITYEGAPIRLPGAGARINLIDAPGSSTANSAARIFNIFGNLEDTGAFWYGSHRNPRVRSQVEMRLPVPTLYFSVGGTSGAQGRAAGQTTGAQNLQSDTLPDTGNPSFFTSLGRGVRRHLLRNRGTYGTLGGSIAGSTITGLLSGDGGSGVSQEDLLRMSQWQHAYTMAMEQRSLWLRLSGGMLSVPGNFLNNLRSYGWTDLQINAYRKRFAGA